MNLREKLDLNGVWKFMPDFSGEGEMAGYQAMDFDDQAWREAAVPGCFDFQHEGLQYYEGAAWYRRQVFLPAHWQGRRLAINFDGVNQRARVWMNGIFLGENRDSYLPFEFALGGAARLDAVNTLAICIDNTRHFEDVPGILRGWRTYGGILRDVKLSARNYLRLEQLQLNGDPGNGRLSVKAIVKNDNPQAMSAVLDIEIRNPQGTVCALLQARDLKVGANSEVSCELGETVARPLPWTPQTPALYQARAVLRDTCGGQALDECASRFGFRNISARAGKIFLNGEPVFLVGFNRHEDSPTSGLAKNLEMARRDFLDMKRMGANFVRLSHYPHDSGELDLCDELGLLVMDEIPFYWWGWEGFKFGSREPSEQKLPLQGEAEGIELKLAAARRALKKMVARDFNHPSIIFWSVSNETMDTHDDVIAGNNALVRHVRKLDPSRLATHVSFRWHIRAAFDEDDVMCLNEYPSWGGRGCEPNPEFDFQKGAGFWRENIEKLHAKYPDKPILITEFGYPCLEGVLGNALGEDMQARTIETEPEGMRHPAVCGLVIWCYADHPWAGGGGFRAMVTSPYGVMTRERRPLRGHAAAARLFAARGQSAPAQPVEAEPKLTDAVYMYRDNLLDLPEARFPDGFDIRAFRWGEEGLWLDIERDADHIPIADDLFVQEFGGDRAGAERRCFFVVDSRGVAVGTISAWHGTGFRDGSHGRVHWLAIRPAYQGRGLGRAALAYALRRMTAWHSKAWLASSGERRKALKMYLDYGFMPVLEDARSVAVWRLAQKELSHPILQQCLQRVKLADA